MNHYRWMIAIALLTTACSMHEDPPRTIRIQQTWQLQIGDQVANHRIVAGLGDISIALDGDSVYAPFSGRVQRNTDDCILFSSPDVPAYLFRLCGVSHLTLGEVQQGTAIGSGAYLHFATLRKQTDGTWALVEPARDILERILKPS